MRTQAETEKYFVNKRLPVEGTVHLIGIGGAGMSGIARILMHHGRKVTGSDTAESATVLDLRRRGAEISIGHRPENSQNADVVIVSDAIDLKTNPEFLAAVDEGKYLLKRSQALAAILEGKRTIAVSGSHGKSTTTAILGQIMESAGADPLVIVGADVSAFDHNVRLGEGELAIVEACEAYGGMLDLDPAAVLLVNLEPEHLDYHGNWENLRDATVRFAESSSSKPKLIFCEADSGASEVAHEIVDSLGYSLLPELKNGEMRVLGEHNRLNASGAVVMAERLGFPREKAIAAARTAVGCDRRLQFIGSSRGVTVFDDYAHHPTEVESSIAALKEEFPRSRLIVVYQPHLYSRTHKHLEEFASAFSAADLVVMTDIYPAREEPVPGVSSAVLVERLEAAEIRCEYVPSRHLLPRIVARTAREGDLVVGMGAGTIDSFAGDLISELERQSELRVAVAYGGESAEREVSINSGKMAAAALKEKGYNVTEFDPSEMLLGKGDVSSLIGPNRPDIVFIALHGTGAEDGRIQGFLDLLHIPFIGSGIEASAVAMNKDACKRMLQEAGLPVPKGIVITKADSTPNVSLPCVVKPNAQGSTIGLSFVHEPEQLEPAIAKALKYDNAALVEEFIEGVEISVPVVGDEALPVVEICPKSGAYDYLSKYTVGATVEIVPARISQADTELAQKFAVEAHRLVGAHDLSRTDMIVSPDGIKILEINTLPGLTSTSLLPNSAAAVGISYGDLCERILRNAMKRYGIQKDR